MATDPTGYAGPHPDLSNQICDMANMLAEQSREHYSWPSRQFAPADFTILGQRTWTDVVTINHVINGGGVSAMLVSATIDGSRYGGLVTAGNKANSDSWGLMGASFGPAMAGDSVSGDLGGSGHHCIGFYGSTAGFLKHLHALEIEYADGTVHRAERKDDDCTSLLALVERWEQTDNEYVVRYLGTDGSIVHSETRWLGGGLGPPGTSP